MKCHRGQKIIVVYLFGLLGFSLSALAGSGVVTITDEVLLEGTKNFGVNVSRDNYDSPMLKKRLNMNFEGTMYQRIFTASEKNDDPTGVVVARTTKTSAWVSGENPLLSDPDAEFWAVSGPNRGEPLKLLSFEKRKGILWGGKKDGLFLKFDKQITVPPWGGIACRVPRLMEGQLVMAGTGSSTDKGCEISHDVPAESTGNSSCLLTGKKSHHFTNIAFSHRMDTKGMWRVVFWAKGVDGPSTLGLKFSNIENQIEVDGDWSKYEYEFEITEDIVANIRFISNLDPILIDDVEVFKMGDKNPTAFSDDLLDVLKTLGGGMPLRSGDLCEGTLENMIQPSSSFFKHDWSAKQKETGPRMRHLSYFMPLHDLYALCAETGNEPWYILPGIMKPEELAHFIEYLAAPADVGWGKIRAANGQIEPWTDVLKEIHLEIGNETWNLMFWGANCSGPDYWSDLIEAAHSSPYWKDNISIILNQRYLSKEYAQVTKIHPKADAYDFAPYVIHSIKIDHTEFLDNDAKLFRWVFGEGIRFARAHHKDSVNARKNGGEFIIYEINHHLRYGYSPVDFCQKFQSSVGGGINIASTMLLHLKENEAKTQCLFKLLGGGVNKEVDQGVWGTVFSIREDQRMYHPIFQAVSVMNKALGGDLLETIQEDVAPFQSYKEESLRFEVLLSDNPEGALSISDAERHEMETRLIRELVRHMSKEEATDLAKEYMSGFYAHADPISSLSMGRGLDLIRRICGAAGGKLGKMESSEVTVDVVREVLFSIKSEFIKKVDFVEEEMPAVWSYAFKDGNKHSLILINLDPEASRNVQLKFSSVVKGGVAKLHLLTSEQVTDANWLEDGESTVEVETSEISGFQSGSEIVLAPFSLQSIVWEEE